MVRLAVLTTLAACTCAAPSAWAGGQPGPICRIPTVLDVMAREVRSRDYYGRINPAYVAEEPDARPDVVNCRVEVRTVRYDSDRFGRVPVARLEFHEFAVEAVRRGFVVRYIR